MIAIMVANIKAAARRQELGLLKRARA